MRKEHTYHICGQTPFGWVEMDIARSEVESAKNQLVVLSKVDKGAYSDMVSHVSSPAGLMLTRLIRGTRYVHWMLNACIIINRLAIVCAIVLLVMRRWWLALVCAVLAYVIGGPLQTSINYELGARLLALEGRLQDNAETQS